MSSAFAGADVQTGVAADAFYAKATNIVGLLHIIERMADTDASSAPRPEAVTPIWVDIPTGEAYIMMTCTECLRTFPLVPGKAKRLIHEADCVYCRSLIHYAIVEPALPAAAWAIQQSADAEYQPFYTCPI